MAGPTTRPVVPPPGGPIKVQLTSAVTGPKTRQNVHPKLVLLVILIAFHRVIDRWISQESMLVLEALQLVYIGFSVPFRLGLLYDPLGTASTSSAVSTYVTYGLDVVSDVIAFLVLMETLKDMIISIPVQQLAPMDMNFSSDTDRRNSAFMNKLVKMSTSRQETMRRNSVFLAKETSMKPQFLLSSSWDKKRQVSVGHVVLDGIALIPFDFFWLTSPHAMIVCRLPKLLRIHKVPEAARLFKHMLADHQLLAGFHNIGMSLLVGVILLSLVLIHWAACFVLLVSHLECGYHLDQPAAGSTCWAVEAKLRGASLFRTYVYTLVTVGYGFPVPQTNLERAIGIAIQFMRSCIAGGIIGAYFFLFECQNRHENEFHDQVDGVKEYLTARRLSKHIQAKVLDFYEHFWSAQRGIDENTIIATLPSHIQTQCYHSLRLKLLKNVPIFRNQPAHVLKRLMCHMKRQCYGRLDWIIRNDSCQAIHMVSRGRIALLNANQVVLTNVTDGQCFGLSSVLHQVTDHATIARELHSARAETYTDVYTLDPPTIEDVVLHHAPLGAITWNAMLAEARGVLDKISVHAKLVHGMTFVEKVKDMDKWYLPQSRFRKKWEIGVVVVLVLYAIDIPLHIAFDAPNGWPVLAGRVLLDLFLLVDFYLRVRWFAYFDHDTVITAPFFIWREYMRNGLVLDAISNIPFALVADCLPASAPSWLTLTLQIGEWSRFLRMRNLVANLSGVLKQFQVNNTTFIIACLALCVPFTCHIGGCVWYWIASVTMRGAATDADGALEALTMDQCLEWARDFQNCTWLHYDRAQYGHSVDYVRAISWSVVSLVTVQFGSIFPFTDVECVYMFVWLFLSSMANFGALGALANAVTRINWATSMKQMQVAVAHRFMASERTASIDHNNLTMRVVVLGVSRHVRHDVSNYYKHHWTQSTEEQVLRVLRPLPDNLRQEIQSFLHAKSVSRLTIFQDVDDAGLRFIYSIMKHHSFKRHEFIVRAGDACDNIYILTRGIMESFVPIDDMMTPMQLLYPGSCVGESAFVQKRSHDVSIRVVSESADVSVLSRHEFATIAKHFEPLWNQIDQFAKDVYVEEMAAMGPFEINLRKPTIYRTLKHTPTLYIEPALGNRLIRPSSTMYRFWRLLITVVVIYNVIQIPFRIALVPTPADNAMLVFSTVDIVCDVIFLIDMYIKYNHLIITDKNGDEVVSVAFIRSNYLHGAFKIEALSSLPLYYVGDYKLMTLCRLPRLLRCYQLSDLLHAFHTFVQERTTSTVVTEGLEFVKLFVGIVLASHVAATGLYVISYAEHGAANHGPTASGHAVLSWYSHDSVIEQCHGSIGATYLRAFYWGLGVSSFDYMDMHLSQVGETLWFCVVALSGVVFIGVVIGQVCTAIFNANKELREVEMHLDNFAFYAKIKSLPPFLLRRAKLFFEFQLDCNMGMDAHVIFRDLPQSLRIELFKDLYTKLLAPIPLFSSLTQGVSWSLLRLRGTLTRLHKPVGQMNTIAEKLHTSLYLPGDNILVEGDVGTSLYFMKQGLGEKYLRSCHIVIAPLYQGAVFGELGFFQSIRYVYCVRAVKCCEILSLSKADWVNAWSPDIRSKLEAKMTRDIQHEIDLLGHIIPALKQNFGISRPRPFKLTMMLQSSSSAGVPQTTADVSGRNYFEYLRHTAPPKAKKNPLATAPLKEFPIWSFGPPPNPRWEPESAVRKCWDLVMLFAITYFALVLPFQAAFVVVPDETPLWLLVWFAWDHLLDLVCVVDTIARWQVFYVFARGELQTQPAVLRRHYTQHGHFYSDLVGLLPLELLVYVVPHANTNPWRLASLLRLNRMVRLVHVPKLMTTVTTLLHHWAWFHRYKVLFHYFTSYIAPFVVVSHWIACMWFYVSMATRTSASPSWLVTMGYLDLNTTMSTADGIPLGFSDTIKFTSLNVYLASLYYAVSSLTSQSFGDVFSENVVETWATVGIILFSIAFFGVLVGVFSEMLQDTLHPRASFEQHMVDVSTFFNYRLLPFQFFIQTSRYCRTQWQDHMGRTEDDFLSVLSTTIREDIAMFVKQNVVKNLSFLNHCEEVFVRALVTKLHTEEYIVSDIIFQLGDVARVLYFIDAGHITLVASKKASKQCNTWDFFGGSSLFADTGRQATAIANVNCTMFLLHYDDFVRLIERFPEYYENCRSEWNHSDAVEMVDTSQATHRLVDRQPHGR
ncbi:hypothetical protein DYB32_006803 [Aphanomyces invadans]|uniref:Cyclic nucleotide-binding domain-containing protein n=1 Tax=Aphanomyces invadans TaxID=157072 RepID=A0A3R6Z2D4_9STRA|nr:hypothetical protein DYB32_006803 [Aphanomyces invadans]